MKDAVVITGMGVMTPLGSTPSELWHNLLEGRSAVRAWNDLAVEGFRQHAACRIEDVDCEPKRRGQHMVYHCIDQALAQAGIEPPAHMGVFVGSTMGESAAFEQAAMNSDLQLTDYTTAAMARLVHEKYRTQGPAIALGTACAAGNYALSMAAESLIRQETDIAIAGGVDPFSRIAMAGFSRSRAMSPDGTCRPFDKQRNGMILGEGAAFFVLERAEDAGRRNTRPLAVVGAMGMTCDAYHPTAPDPSGAWMESSMRQALTLQGITPEEIAWICVHGSGTHASDETEAAALDRMFEGCHIPVSGFKGAVGHTLGAATAIEAAICVLSLTHQVIPPTTGCMDPIDTTSTYVINEPHTADISWILNSGYAFGGLNTSLLIGSWN